LFGEESDCGVCGLGYSERLALRADVCFSGDFFSGGGGDESDGDEDLLLVERPFAVRAGGENEMEDESDSDEDESDGEMVCVRYELSRGDSRCVGSAPIVFPSMDGGLSDDIDVPSDVGGSGVGDVCRTVWRRLCERFTESGGFVFRDHRDAGSDARAVDDAFFSVTPGALFFHERSDSDGAVLSTAGRLLYDKLRVVASGAELREVAALVRETRGKHEGLGRFSAHPARTARGSVSFFVECADTFEYFGFRVKQGERFRIYVLFDVYFDGVDMRRRFRVCDGRYPGFLCDHGCSFAHFLSACVSFAYEWCGGEEASGPERGDFCVDFNGRLLFQ
jgi:hypothetical protein